MTSPRTGPAPAPPPTREADARALEALPTLPLLAGRLIDMALDEKSSAEELGDLIAKDPSLTARLLKVVSSASYGLRREVTSIPHAVSIVGRQRLRSLVLGMSIFDTLGERKDATGFDPTVLWRHAVAAAAAARLLASAAGRVNPEEAYIAGLTHDLGKLVLERFNPAAFRRALAEGTAGGADEIRAVEARVCGIDHPDAGGRLAERWELPAGLRAAMRCHHDPSLAESQPMPIRRLVAVTTAADFLAWQCGYPSFEATRPPAADATTRKLLERIDGDAVMASVREEVGRCAEVFHYAETTPESVQRAMFRANAELGRLLAEQDGAQRRLSAITEVLLNAQRLVAGQAPADHVLSAIVERLGYDRAYLLALGEDGRTLAVERFAGAEGRACPNEGKALPLADSWALRQREPSLLVAERSGAEDAVLAVLGAREAMLTPLPDTSSPKRFLAVERARGFSELEPAMERMVQTTLSHCVALLLENHRLFRRAQELAITDGLTGVANRRALIDALEVAVAGAARGLPPCALVLVDLDWFKRINDESGHPAGDRVLRDVATALKRSCRGADLVGRFGGEEFCILLADARVDDAAVVAERARGAVEALGRALAPELRGRAVTISAGVAEHREGESAGELLARADAALYRAKDGGRNRVERA